MLFIALGGIAAVLVIGLIIYASIIEAIETIKEQRKS